MRNNKTVLTLFFKKDCLYEMSVLPNKKSIEQLKYEVKRHIILGLGSCSVKIHLETFEEVTLQTADNLLRLIFLL